MMRGLTPLLAGETEKHTERDQQDLEADLDDRSALRPRRRGQRRRGRSRVVLVEIRHVNIRHGALW